MDALTLTLMASAALLAVAFLAIWQARGARAEVARLRADGAAALRELEEARRAALVAQAAGEGHARRVEERDARLTEVAGEMAGLRFAHREAEARCSDAESRCAKATEAGERLDLALRQLRQDHAAATLALREDAQATQARLRSVEEEFSKLGARHAALERDRDARVESAEREVARLREIREEMTREFQALASATLRETGTQFSEAHQQKLTELLTPFREQVGRFETELREVHKGAGVDRAVLHEQIRALTTQTQAVSQEAVNLTRALKGEKHRQGAWGEGQLEQYLIHMGYEKDVHYFTQASRTDEAGERWRPDVILRMPGGKCLVIDSKVSLVSYSAAIGAETDEERTRHLRDHVRAVRTHIDTLAAKGYQNLENGSVDWVLLFMPIEGAVSAAWAHEADIGTYAMERRIGIAYPTTLLMALKTVRQLWDIETRNANAEDIATRAGLLYDKVVGFVESFTAVGSALERAGAAHEKAMGQLKTGSGNLIGQVEKLKRLGAKTSKSLALAFEPEPEPDSGAAEAAPGQPAPRILPAAE